MICGGLFVIAMWTSAVVLEVNCGRVMHGKVHRFISFDYISVVVIGPQLCVLQPAVAWHVV